MPLYEETQKQKERNERVHSYVTAEKSLESLRESVEPREELIDEAQMQQDAVSLGKKKTFKPNDEQKRRNAEIDRARKQTGIKKATADTFAMHEDIAELKKSGAEAAPEEQLQLLRATQFSQRMLTSANIRAHFAEYMQLVQAYESLQALARNDIELRERLAPLKENMELFTSRMKAFCSRNRLHLDGSYMEDKEEEESFRLDRKQLLKGNPFGIVPPEDYVPGLRVYTDTEKLKKVMSDASGDGEPALSEEYQRSGRNYALMDAKGRVESIPGMRGDLILLARDIEKLEEENKKAHDPELSRQLVELRKEKIELMACLRLAEAEARVILATDADQAKKRRLVADAKDAYADYSYILVRHAKQKLPLTSYAAKAGLMDRGKALSSVSDKQNYAFKQAVYKEAIKLNAPGLEEVKQLAIEYAESSHYSVGHEVESALLQRLRLAIREQVKRGNGDAVANLSLKLAQLDGPTNAPALPAWKDIPKALQIDCSGKKLKEKGSVHDKGAVRNWFLTNDASQVWDDRSGEPLFAHEPTVNDLRQGKISNCYMLAATTALIDLDPQMIKRVIRDNGDDTVTIRLYGETGPQFIRVDKKTARLRSGGSIATDGPLWMQLIEIAAAHVGMFKKDRQGFGSLWYGTGGEWFSMLTGCSAAMTVKTTAADGRDVISGDVKDADGLFERIRDAHVNQEVFHMGTKASATKGMNSGHAYTVLGAKEVGGKKYVTLRNPYANMAYRKDEYGDEEMSSGYTSSVADETCGQFDMPLEEFIRNAASISYTTIPKDMFPGGESKEALEKTAAAMEAEKVRSAAAVSSLIDAMKDDDLDDDPVLETEVKKEFKAADDTVFMTEEELKKEFGTEGDK